MLAVRVLLLERLHGQGRRATEQSADNFWIAWRTSAAVAVAGIGRPNATLTGYGNFCGHFHRKRPPWLLKMLPHTWSRHTGTIGAGVRLRICSKPRWNGSMKPVRVMLPSAKMQTASPLARASPAVRSD